MTTETQAIYDDRSQFWSSDPGINRIFLRTINSHANDLLRSRGHLFLNEVHDLLGLPRTSEGQLLGWLKQDSIRLWTEWRIEGEISVGLTFETHGVIYDKIE